jgi:hypothetical protein
LAQPQPAFNRSPNRNLAPANRTLGRGAFLFDTRPVRHASFGVSQDVTGHHQKRTGLRASEPRRRSSLHFEGTGPRPDPHSPHRPGLAPSTCPSSKGGGPFFDLKRRYPLSKGLPALGTGAPPPPMNGRPSPIPARLARNNFLFLACRNRHPRAVT